MKHPDLTNVRLESGVRPTKREGGFQLLELTMAMSILLVGLLGFMFSFQGNFGATRDLAEQDFEAATIINLKEYFNSIDFRSLYGYYNNSYWWIPAGIQTVSLDSVMMGMDDENGVWPLVRVEFFVNEQTMPAEFGPVGDIDGDGAMQTGNASTTYEVLPCRLTLFYQSVNDPSAREHYFLLTPDSEI